MSASLADYEDCVRFLLEACITLGEVIDSVLLNGSLAIDKVCPGKSDVLDVLVVLKDFMREDAVVYGNVLLVFSHVCQRVAAKGLPFHAFHFAYRSELSGVYPVRYRDQWRCTGWSKVLAGEDVRMQVTGCTADWEMARRGYYAQRRSNQRLIYFKSNPVAVPENREYVGSLILNFARDTIFFAGALLGISLIEQELIPELGVLIPELYCEGLEHLQRTYKHSRLPDSMEEIQSDILLVLTLSEQLHSGILRLQTGPIALGDEQSGGTK